MSLIVQLKAKDKWINQLLDAHAEMKKLLLDNGISMSEDVKNAETPPELKQKKTSKIGRTIK